MADLFRSGVLLMRRRVVTEGLSDFGEFSPSEALFAKFPLIFRILLHAAVKTGGPQGEPGFVAASAAEPPPVWPP